MYQLVKTFFCIHGVIIYLLTEKCQQADPSFKTLAIYKLFKSFFIALTELPD